MQTCVGLLQQTKNGGAVTFDRPDPLLGREVWIDANNLSGAPFGMKVVCELLQKITEPVSSPAKARIIEVLGDPQRPDVAMLSIIRQHNLPEKFPELVMERAAEYPLQLDLQSIETEISKGRIDLRDQPIMTIDGEEAKDLDDAVNIETLPGGRFRLGVHIADVTHYVQEDDILDQEAQKRATSVYLVDRVLPMLPPRLSNGICSLNPDQDRLTLSAILVIGPDGEIESGELCETVIRSKARASYTEVKNALETMTLPEGREAWFLTALKQMNDLADRLRQKRIRRGSIEFEFPETHVELDADGNPVDIYPYPISFANGIIEEFMIAANEFIAHRAESEKLPFLFRVHELPDPEKLKRFTTLARILGVRTRLRGAPTPGQLAKILETVKSEPYGQTLSQLLLRSLAKARYAPDNLGHFGLASAHYCHFTSPIRRYPDLFIHRVLKAHIHDNLNKKRLNGIVDDLAEHTSDMERVAMYAERDTVDQKAAEYLSERIGETFSGIISGFNQAGIYVQLENTVEGMVPFRTMSGYLSYEEDRLRVVNQTSGQIYGIGDAVTVQVAQVDKIQRRIDFEMISHLDRELLILSAEQKAKKSRPDQKKSTGDGGRKSQKEKSGQKKKSKQSKKTRSKKNRSGGSGGKKK